MHLRLIDFHTHYYEESWSLAPVPPGLLRSWPLLTDIEAQLRELGSAGIDAKVLSAPASILVAPGQQMPGSALARINDRFAELVARHPQQLYALATIDAFQGEAAAREAERAIQELGLDGLCVDCASGDRFLDAPEARSTLEVAAKLDVALFVHPVSPVGLTEHLSQLGHTGVLLARGTENAASLLALLRSAIFDEFPTLKIVFPFIGAASLLFAGIADQEYEREGGWGTTKPGIARTRLYVDTMGFDPASIRFAIELLGTEQVLLGSDWPIMPLRARQNIEELLTSLKLSQEQQAAILGGNTLRLLKRHTLS